MLVTLLAVETGVPWLSFQPVLVLSLLAAQMWMPPACRDALQQATMVVAGVFGCVRLAV
jgi:hypothetical protein